MGVEPPIRCSTPLCTTFCTSQNNPTGLQVVCELVIVVSKIKVFILVLSKIDNFQITILNINVI